MKINEKEEREKQGESEKAERTNGAGKKHILEERSHSHTGRAYRE